MANRLQAKRRNTAEEIEDAVAAIPHETDQLDAIATIRGWYDTYGGANVIINEYMGGGLETAEAATQLATIIDALYTRANNVELSRTAGEELGPNARLTTLRKPSDYGAWSRTFQSRRTRTDSLLRSKASYGACETRFSMPRGRSTRQMKHNKSG